MNPKFWAFRRQVDCIVLLQCTVEADPLKVAEGVRAARSMVHGHVPAASRQCRTSVVPAPTQTLTSLL
jgi:hypothetical protein